MELEKARRGEEAGCRVSASGFISGGWRVCDDDFEMVRTYCILRLGGRVGEAQMLRCQSGEQGLASLAVYCMGRSSAVPAPGRSETRILEVSEGNTFLPVHAATGYRAMMARVNYVPL